MVHLAQFPLDLAEFVSWVGIGRGFARGSSFLDHLRALRHKSRMATSRQFYPELQSVRGVAAVAVLIGHSLIFFENPIWFVKLGWIADAHAAVVVFFVLSGFVLSNSLRDGARNMAAILAFYIRRGFRIYPGVWVCSLVALVYVALVHYNIALAHESDWFKKRFLAERYTVPSVVTSFAAVNTFLLPQLWTIYIELIASAAMPLIAMAAFTSREWVRLTVAAALIVLSFATPPEWKPAIVGVYLVDFYLGALLFASSAQIGRAVATLGRFQRPVLFASLFVLVASQYAVSLSYDDPGKNLGEALLAVLIIAIFAFGDNRPQWAGKPSWVWLGDISYSVYLVHFPVMCFVGTAIGAAGFAFSGPLWNIAVAIGTLALTIPLSGFLYRHVEKPGIEWGKNALTRLKLGRPRDGELPAL